MRLTAALSLDMDNQWSYMKTHGDSGWESYPSYYDVLVPSSLELLDRLGVKITYFVVGRDAVDRKNAAFLKMITDNGHDVGNHSFNHEPWLHLYSKEKISDEISQTDKAIKKASGRKPSGFRGPGFSWSRDLLDVLSGMDYAYDASTLPTWIGPLARAYYFKSTSFSGEEKEQRKKLFGGFSDGFRRNKPYRWDLGSGKSILEIPVTTMPVMRIPFHLSYLLYVYRLSPGLMRMYLKTACNLCRAAGFGPSFLLHPLDIISGDAVPSLSFFPGMDIRTEEKSAVFLDVIKILSEHFELLPMDLYSAGLSPRKLATKRPGV